MASFVDSIRTFFRERKGSRLVLILLAAILLELVAAVQYWYTRDMLREEQGRISRMELTMNEDVILHTLEDAEMTMRENMWSIRQSLSHPDSLFGAAVRLISGNPLVSGGCIAVVPDYYPEKGRLFEPYAHKVDGRPVVDQIAGPDHDYTEGPDFSRALSDGTGFWGEPYAYCEDAVLQLTTYTCPVWDRDGRIAAICGLDVDLTWLSDTLNAHPYYPSSFGFMLTQEGKPVTAPSAGAVSPETLDYVAALMADSTAVRSVRGHNRIFFMEFRDPASGRKAYLDYKALPRDPGWILAQVSYRDEVLSPVRSMMWKILLMALAGLALLLIIVDRFIRNGKRLWEADLREARLGGELRVAGRIQEEMLPKSIPDTEGLAVKALLTPAREVGGDLYDYSVRNGKLYFSIGDVSGKGVPASMLMSAVLFLLRMAVDREEDDPARIVGDINRSVCRNNESGMFVTLFLGILDLSTGLLRYCNAGHDRPVLFRDAVEDLPALAHLPAGLFPDYAYGNQEVTVAPGTVLFLYTDGVTEAKDADRRQYGKERLNASLTGSPHDPDRLLKRVMEDIRSFAGETEQSDDITLLTIRYDPIVKAPLLDETLTLAAKRSEVRLLGDFIKGISARLGLGDRPSKDLRLALEEAVVNVIDYAYPAEAEGEVTVRARSDGKKLELTVSDDGVPFDPTAAPVPDLSVSATDRPAGGLGIFLARSLTDALRYERREGKNRLTLEKNLESITDRMT